MLYPGFEGSESWGSPRENAFNVFWRFSIEIYRKCIEKRCFERFCHLKASISMWKHVWSTLWARYSSYWSVLTIFDFHPHSPGGHGRHLLDKFQRKSLFLTVSSNTQSLYRSQITIDQLYGLELGCPYPFQWFFMSAHIDQGFTGVR